MIKRFLILSLGTVLSFPVSPSFGQSLPLVPVSDASQTVGFDEQLWGNQCSRGDKQALLQAINHSLTYLNTAHAANAYQNYPVKGITRDRVRRSLVRFKTLLQQSPTPEALQAAIQKEFQFYQSVGNDQKGTVHFTCYFEPIYTASRRRTAEYRYPIYAKPVNFGSWKAPHPTRATLEGIDGLGTTSPIKGQEIAWFNRRLDAYLIQVQGSAKLNWLDGGKTSIAFAGTTNYPYTSLGKETIAAGIFQPGEVTLPKLIDYFEQNPSELDRFIPRNNRMVFFKETSAATPAKGSLGVPVTAERSV
ncbi:MAG: MltA domain-containing protein, partial [Synechocystis sp.]